MEKSHHMLIVLTTLLVTNYYINPASACYQHMTLFVFLSIEKYNQRWGRSGKPVHRAESYPEEGMEIPSSPRQGCCSSGPAQRAWVYPQRG